MLSESISTYALESFDWLRVNMEFSRFSHFQFYFWCGNVRADANLSLQYLLNHDWNWQQTYYESVAEYWDELNDFYQMLNQVIVLSIPSLLHLCNRLNQLIDVPISSLLWNKQANKHIARFLARKQPICWYLLKNKHFI